MNKLLKLMVITTLILSLSSRLLDGEEGEKKPEETQPAEGQTEGEPVKTEEHKQENPEEHKEEKKEEVHDADKNKPPVHSEGKMRTYLLVTLAILVIGGTCAAFILGKN